MDRSELIRRAREIIAEAYEEAAWLIAGYLERHPSEQLTTLCKEIDPDNWNALRHRVQRAQVERRSSLEAQEAARTRLSTEGTIRSARSVARTNPRAHRRPAFVVAARKRLPERATWHRCARSSQVGDTTMIA